MVYTPIVIVYMMPIGLSIFYSCYYLLLTIITQSIIMKSYATDFNSNYADLMNKFNIHLLFHNNNKLTNQINRSRKR